MSSEHAETTFFSKMGQKFVTKPKKLVFRKKNEKPVVIDSSFLHYHSLQIKEKNYLPPLFNIGYYIEIAI